MSIPCRAAVAIRDSASAPSRIRTKAHNSADKGIKLRDRLTTMHQRHAAMLPQAGFTAEDLQDGATMLRRLERFWIRAGDVVQRPPQFAA